MIKEEFIKLKIYLKKDSSVHSVRHSIIYFLMYLDVKIKNTIHKVNKSIQPESINEIQQIV